MPCRRPRGKAGGRVAARRGTMPGAAVSGPAGACGACRPPAGPAQLCRRGSSPRRWHPPLCNRMSAAWPTPPVMTGKSSSSPGMTGWSQCWHRPTGAAGFGVVTVGLPGRCSSGPRASRYASHRAAPVGQPWRRRAHSGQVVEWARYTVQAARSRSTAVVMWLPGIGAGATSASRAMRSAFMRHHLVEVGQCPGGQRTGLLVARCRVGMPTRVIRGRGGVPLGVRRSTVRSRRTSVGRSRTPPVRGVGHDGWSKPCRVVSCARSIHDVARLTPGGHAPGPFARSRGSVVCPE